MAQARHMPIFFCDFSIASIITFHCSWETVINSFWLSKNEEIQKVCQTNYIYVYWIHLTFCPYLLQVTVRFLGERSVIEALSDTRLPQPSTNTLQVLSVHTNFCILKTIRYMYMLYPLSVFSGVWGRCCYCQGNTQVVQRTHFFKGE